MKTEGLEVKDIRRDEDGHIVVKARDFLRDKEKTIILTDANEKKLRELLE